jgi:hypothetical protein
MLEEEETNTKTELLIQYNVNCTGITKYARNEIEITKVTQLVNVTCISS